MSICRKHRGTPDFPGQDLNFCKFENGTSSSTQLNVAWCEDSKSGFLLFWIVLVNELALVFLTAFNTEAGIIFYNKISARSNFLTVGFQKKHDWWNLISWSSRVQCCAQIFLTMRWSKFGQAVYLLASSRLTYGESAAAAHVNFPFKFQKKMIFLKKSMK